MLNKHRKKPVRKIFIVLSLLAIGVWAILGTGASLAWFADTSPEVNNIFHFADFDVEVSHRLPDGTWEKVDSQTKIFDDQAIYEPGYTQVVYLKVENKGERAFEFQTAVNVTEYTTATNIFGQTFNLQDHLKFGLISEKTEAELNNSLADREKANNIAKTSLNNYSTDTAMLDVGETSYIALIVYMPQDVNNVANYRGETVPKVELGVIVKADQIK